MKGGKKRSRAEEDVPATAGANHARTKKKTKKPGVVVDSNWRTLLQKGVVKSKKFQREPNRHELRRERERAKLGHKEARKVAEAPTVDIDWSRRPATGDASHFCALDCEMVGVGPQKVSSLARVCVVDSQGGVLLDMYCKPKEEVTDYRTRWSGIRAKDLKDAPGFFKVQTKVADIIRGRILVGHQIDNDLEVLGLKHPFSLIRDTARYEPLQKIRTTGTKLHAAKLKDLTKMHLGKEIQDGEHDPYIDARAALELYKLFEKQWEAHVLLKRQENRVKRARKHRREIVNDILDQPEDYLKNSSAPAVSQQKPVEGDIFTRSRRRETKHNRKKY